MRKWLAIFGLLLGIAPMVPGQPNIATNPKEQPAKQIETEGKPVGADKINKQTDSQANQTKLDPDPPKWYAAFERPDWWLVIVAALTGGVIGWQSFATAKAAKAAFLQIQMMKDKERARVEIRALGLELTRVSNDFWHVKATIELRNVGAGRAFVRLGMGKLLVEENNVTTDPQPSLLNVVDGFIDPTGDPVTESFYFFQPEDAALSEYSQKICDGSVALYVAGFIEYETVGTRFHRDFDYVWMGQEHPLNIGAKLTFFDEFNPKTDEDRISLGFWAPVSRWNTGREGNNDEYEMEAPKRAKNPKKAN